MNMTYSESVRTFHDIPHHLELEDECLKDAISNLEANAMIYGPSANDLEVFLRIKMNLHPHKI